MEEIEKVESPFLKPKIPKFGPGDVLRVYHKFFEGDRERVQAFQGTVIRIRGSGLRKSITLRKVTKGIGIEWIFQLHSPSITRVEVRRRGKVRRAKLFYLRRKKGKKARVKERRVEKRPRPKKVEE